VVICLERVAECLHMIQLMPLPSQNPIVFCLIYIQTGFTFLIPAYPGCTGKEVRLLVLLLEWRKIKITIDSHSTMYISVLFTSRYLLNVTGRPKVENLR